ncbi:PAAR domain-containing protein [Achromobacter sp. ACM05]|uniref:PAAR domain-containing protein n=1 Tax=Achromobacter sp. ACM05 TaxID=2854776 RepID=UPI001C45721C|nr:PAAR domain-containing protein [Achromobacter sp. ACM05]MBV7503436.1 PAAR domain-containing protein [Achromobacter sp. ACM05]
MAGRAVVRIGDKTSHGGTVTQGFPQYTIEGRAAAGMGHLVACPQCKGTYPIVEGVSSFIVDDGLVAIEGMKTACGATLIASQDIAVLDPGPGDIARTSSNTGLLANSLREPGCTHADTAVPLAEFIVREMKTNPFSRQGREIHDANHYDFKAYNEDWERAAWYTKLSGRNTYAQMLAEKKLHAYALFADIIGPNRPWDHKPALRQMLGEHFNIGWQKYGDFDYYFDIWSNIHFGYVGIALGFTAAELIKGAGLAQAALDVWKRKPQQNHPQNGPWPASADDVTDHISIKLGIDLYGAAKPHELTANMLLHRVSAVPLPWGYGNDVAKEPHTCRREPKN